MDGWVGLGHVAGAEEPRWNYEGVRVGMEERRAGARMGIEWAGTD